MSRLARCIASVIIGGLVGCSSSVHIVGIKVTGPILLLDLFPQAHKTTEPPAKLQERVRVTEIRIESKPERVLFLHPKSVVTFSLRIERSAILDTAIALAPEVWDNKEADGVTFYVQVRREGEGFPTYLFSRHLYPQLLEEHRGWQPVRIDLTPFRNTDIELILATDPGPKGNPLYDWAVWRDPRIYNPITDEAWATTISGAKPDEY